MRNQPLLFFVSRLFPFPKKRRPVICTCDALRCQVLSFSLSFFVSRYFLPDDTVIFGRVLCVRVRVGILGILGILDILVLPRHNNKKRQIEIASNETRYCKRRSQKQA